MIKSAERVQGTGGAEDGYGRGLLAAVSGTWVHDQQGGDADGEYDLRQRGGELLCASGGGSVAGRDTVGGEFRCFG